MNCSVEDCERPRVSRGWCRLHYVRWQRTGDPTALKPRLGRPPLTWQKLLSRVQWQPSGCWEWQGCLNNGYGIIGRNGTTQRVHRIVFARLVGDPPEGYDLDHLCRNRKCCNPLHLEPVTRAENLRRGVGPEVTRQRHAARRAAAVGGQ